MTTPRPSNPAARAVVTTGVAALVIALAAMMPPPVPVSPAAGRVPNPPGASSQRPSCTDSLGLQLQVLREPGAVAVEEADLRELARLMVVHRGYVPLADSAGSRAPTRLNVSIKLQPRYAQAGVLVRRAGRAARFHSIEGSLPADAGSATVGSVVGAAIQSALDSLPLGNCAGALSVVGNVRIPPPGDRSVSRGAPLAILMDPRAAITAMTEGQTPAFAEVVRRHADALAGLARPADAGIWLVQDSTGRLISSGVLDSFPFAISSGNYKTVVPGTAATGQAALTFGLARTPVIDGAGPFRVVYVTVARRP